MRAAFAVLGYQQQATGIGDQRDEGDRHHHQRFRLTTENKASHHLDEYADSQNQLQYPCQMRGTYLHFRTAPYGIESQAIDGCIGKHIQGISDQAGRLGDQASSHFHHEHDRIDTEQHAQSA